MITPFLIIYLRDARQFPIEQAALVVSTIAVAGLVAAPATGSLIDHFGARRVLIATLLLAAVAVIGTSWVDSPVRAFMWAVVFGSAIAAMWPAAHSLMAVVVAPRERASIYSIHFALLNAGIGIGALVGGTLVNDYDPSSFRAVFALDAATFVVYALVLYFFVKTDARPDGSDDSATQQNGWSRLIADRAFVRVVVLSVGLTSIGYAQLESSFPAYATAEGGISTRALGAVFAVNTLVIVALQLIVLRGLAGRSRSGALGMVGAMWAVSWLITVVGGRTGAVLLFMAAAAVFAIGETFMQAALPALVNDLAPDDIRGRYNAAYSVTWSLGKVLGPAFGGFLLGANRGSLLFMLLAGACGVAAAYGVLLRRFLDADVDLFSGSDKAVEAPSVGADPL